MVLYLIRHARPQGVEGICYGRRDVRVDAAETGRVARELHALLPADVLATAPIYTSPLSRCTALARALVPARAPLVAPELLEVDFGSWEGSPWHDVCRADLDAWAQDPWRYAPGGGESAAAAYSRFHTWATQLSSLTGAAVGVTHAGLIRLALAAGSADPSGLELAIPFGSVHAVSVG